MAAYVWRVTTNWDYTRIWTIFHDGFSAIKCKEKIAIQLKMFRKLVGYINHKQHSTRKVVCFLR